MHQQLVRAPLVCIRVYEYAFGVHVYAHGDQRTSEWFLENHLCCFFWVSSSAWSLLISSDWLVSELQRSSCLYIPRLVFQAQITMLDFYMASGDWTQFLLLAWHMLCWLSSYLNPGEMLFRCRDDMRLGMENKCFGSQIRSLKDFSIWAWLAGMSRIEFKIQFLPKTKISLSLGYGSLPQVMVVRDGIWELEILLDQ